MDKQVRITRVQFNKFKTFPNFGVSLDTTTILVGPNNSGKSTIIGAFRALSIALRTARSRPGVFGFISFRSLKKPRPKRRLLELVVLIVPALLSATLLASFYLVP